MLAQATFTLINHLTRDNLNAGRLSKGSPWDINLGSIWTQENLQITEMLMFKIVRSIWYFTLIQKWPWYEIHSITHLFIHSLICLLAHRLISTVLLKHMYFMDKITEDLKKKKTRKNEWKEGKKHRKLNYTKLCRSKFQLFHLLLVALPCLLCIQEILVHRYFDNLLPSKMTYKPVPWSFFSFDLLFFLLQIFLGYFLKYMFETTNIYFIGIINQFALLFDCSHYPYMSVFLNSRPFYKTSSFYLH